MLYDLICFVFVYRKVRSSAKERKMVVQNYLARRECNFLTKGNAVQGVQVSANKFSLYHFCEKFIEKFGEVYDRL